jgi:recX family
LAELEEGEHSSPREQVLTLLRKKLRTLPPSLERRKVKDRLMRYGLYRGYEYEDVREAVGYLIEEDEI